MNVFIVDDHASFTESLARVLDSESDLGCVGTAGDVETALSALEEVDPDVVLLDRDLPGGDGTDIAADLRRRWPDTRLVVLTDSTEPSVLRGCLDAQVTGVVSKTAGLDTVLDVLRMAACAGPDPTTTVLDRRVIDRLLDAPRPPGGEPASAGIAPNRPTDGDPGLTAREREVLELLSRGLDPATIADELYISTHTARGHVKKILGKLGVHSQLEAVVAAAQLGLVQIDPGTEAAP